MHSRLLFMLQTVVDRQSHQAVLKYIEGIVKQINHQHEKKQNSSKKRKK